MKKTLTFILALLLVLSACGERGDEALRIDEAAEPSASSAVSYRLEKLDRPEYVTDLAAQCDVYGERIYVVATQESGLQVMSVDTESGGWETVCPAFGPSSLALDADGNVWMLGVDDDGAATLYRCAQGASEPALAAELSTLGIAQGGHPESIAFDGGGTLYVLWSHPKTGGGVLALDVSGDSPRRLFSLNTGDDPRLARAGERAFVGGLRDGVYELREIDAENHAWGESRSMDAAAYDLAGGLDGKLYLTIGGDIYALDAGCGELSKLFNLTALGVSNGFCCGALPDGTPIMLTYDYAGGYYVPPSLSLARAGAAVGEVATLRLATTDANSVRQAVLDFNAGSDDVKIELVDYSVYNSEYGDTAGALRLATEIIAGNAPDIYSLHDLSFARYAAKGMLEDLYPYIDDDPELERADFLPGILAAAEYEGKLMALIPFFQIETMITLTDLLPSSGDWTIEDMALIMAEHPDVAPFDRYTGKVEFLRYVAEYYGASFIDWESGVCSFDSPEFISILELAATVRENEWTGPFDAHAISIGEQLFGFYTVHSFSNAGHFRTFGADISAPGFPSARGSGNAVAPTLSLGMSSSCADKDAAWRFLRGFLLPSYQSAATSNFPASATAMEARAQRYRDINPEGKEVEVHAAEAGVYTVIYDPERDISETLAIIDSARTLRSPDKTLEEIILSEAAAYFAGDKSAKECARLIQSRVSLYVAEQS